MADRFLIAAEYSRHSAAPARPLSVPAGFQVAHDTDRYRVYVADGTDVQTHREGCVIGRVQSRNPLSAPYTLGEVPAGGLISTLMAQAWGAYVCVTQSDSGDITVFREPSGALPCYTCAHAGRQLYASDIGVLRAFGVPPFSIDWCFLAWHLGAGWLRTRETALEGLTEVPRGAAATLTRDRQSWQTPWSPWNFTSPQIRSFDDNARLLRETLDACVEGIVRHYPAVSLGLSGGLDSTIVAASLVQAGIDVLPYSLATDEVVGDETRYARIAADALGLSLTRVPYTLDGVDLSRSVAAHLPRPVGLSYQRPLYQYWAEAMGGGRAIVTGNGGDEVFCLMASATPVVDRWLDTRNLIETVRSALDVCRLTGSPLQTVVSRALRTYRGRHSPYAWRTETRFLTPEAIAGSRARHREALRHPWLNPPVDTVPGKKVHVANLLRLQNFVEGPPRDRPMGVIYPLLAQPVMELCLGIPTWQWSSGGRNRTVARAAYADRIPPSLASRVDKGGPEAFAAQVYLTHRTWMRAFLLEGHLVRQGIVDAGEVATSLSVDGPPRGFDYLRLLELADAEAWVRAQSGQA